MHDFTEFEPVENTVEDISRLVQNAGLDEVTPEDGTELLDSHGQQLSNEDLEDLDRELSQQKEKALEKEDEEPPPKCMKTSSVQHILSAMDTLTEELCDSDHDWESTVKVKRTVIISFGPYSEILKKQRGNLNNQHSKLSSKKGKILNQELYHISQISALCHSQSRSTEGHYSGTYKNVQPGL